jgi:uncharacterized protein (DUF1786 family)
MRILAIDTGTGTQDILLLDTAIPIEQSVKMVMPSATEIAARRIRRATQERRPVLLTGVTMGGGPCQWALATHLEHGLRAYATERAALTFDPDLAVVRAMGMTVVSEDEAAALRGVDRIELRDLDLVAVRSALAAFTVPADFDGLAIGCLDHGTPPPGVSDRSFRFDHLRRVIRGRGSLEAFAMLPDEVPEYLTRARSMLTSRDIDVPTVFLDTGAAAALGALHDPHVRERDEQLIVNLGTTHALGFHTSGTRIHGVFEHHTDLLSDQEVESLSERFASGDLTHEEVFAHHGHGVYYADDRHSDDPVVAVTGPRRAKLRGSRLNPHVATPLGDTAISGCLGLVAGFAARFPETHEPIMTALAR